MPRPKEFDPDRAVDAALDVFWAGGYAATSTQDLCEGTGLGRSSLYNTFKSKRELYAQTLHRYAERTRDDLESLIAQSAPARTVLRDFLLAAIDQQLADPERRGCLALNAAVEIGPADTVVAELTRTDFDVVVAAFRAVIERGQRDGDISAGRDPEALARLTHGALTAIHVVGRVAEDRERLTDIVDALLDSF